MSLGYASKLHRNSLVEFYCNHPLASKNYVIQIQRARNIKYFALYMYIMLVPNCVMYDK